MWLAYRPGRTSHATCNVLQMQLLPANSRLLLRVLLQCRGRPCPNTSPHASSSFLLLLHRCITPFTVAPTHTPSISTHGQRVRPPPRQSPFYKAKSACAPVLPKPGPKPGV